MAENAPAKGVATAGGSAAGGSTNGNGAEAHAGIPFYESQRAHLKKLIAKKRELEMKLHSHEEDIYQKETEYLENTPNGNVITGFDNYTKGTGTAAAQRRKMGLTDQNRVFSKSSISYNPNAEAQTPASIGSGPNSLAPTPLSTSFANKDGPSGAPTPTSATATKPPGKKTKKAAAAAALAAAGAEDSETDSRESGKKVRTSFGAVRK